MNLKLKGKHVVITGASSGVGRAAAIAFAKEGCTLILAARRKDELIKTEKLCNEENPDVVITSVSVDVSDDNSVIKFANVVKRLAEHTGFIDVVVNSAAYLHKPALLHETTESEFEKTLQTNVNGPFRVWKHLSQILSREAVVLNISSIAGVQGVTRFPGFGAYTVSKMALGGLTEMMAAEGKKKGIRVNALAPAAVDTPMLYTAFPDGDPKKLRAMTPEEMANHILFHASDLSRPTTGQVLLLK